MSWGLPRRLYCPQASRESHVFTQFEGHAERGPAREPFWNGWSCAIGKVVFVERRMGGGETSTMGAGMATSRPSCTVTVAMAGRGADGGCVVVSQPDSQSDRTMVMTLLRSFLTTLLCEGQALTQDFVSRLRPFSLVPPARAFTEQKPCSM